jgi:hypothetical protein
MIVMLIVLVPLAILFAWAVHDLKRRRRHALPAEVESRAAALKASIQTSYPGAGGGI